MSPKQVSPKRVTGKIDPVAAHEALQEQVLAAALPHVAFDGWGVRAAEAGAADAGLAPGDGLRAFPGGAVDMIEAYNRIADRRMVAEMQARGVDAMKIRERVTLGVRVRLEQAGENRDAVRRGITILAMPQNAAVAAKCLYRTVDAIWYAAGDASTDYNFYTKRGLLAGVYSSTVLYWLNDDSEDHAATWRFLDRRIANVMQVPKLMGKVTGLADRLPNPFRLFRAPARR